MYMFMTSDKIDKAKVMLNAILRAENLNQADTLRTLLLECALQGPAASAIEYFNRYFNKASHSIHHPLLGNLAIFVRKIDESWDWKRKGINATALCITLRPDYVPIDATSVETEDLDNSNHSRCSL